MSEAAFQASAARLRDRYGGGATLLIEQVPSGTAMTLDCSKPLPYSDRLIDGDRIQGVDRQVFVVIPDSPAFTPKPGDLAKVLGQKVAIVDHAEYQGVWGLQLRGTRNA